MEKETNGALPWVIAGVVVVLLGLAGLWAGQKKPAEPKHARIVAGYGEKLAFSDLKMSESTSLSGGKSTFIDGMVRNGGDQTVTAANVQVTFGNDGTMPAQVMLVPLTLIRTHEPYVDTAALSVMPLKAGEQKEFRLIFEDVSANWNQQFPEMRVMTAYAACNPCG